MMLPSTSLKFLSGYFKSCLLCMALSLLIREATANISSDDSNVVDLEKMHPTIPEEEITITKKPCPACNFGWKWTGQNCDLCDNKTFFKHAVSKKTAIVDAEDDQTVSDMSATFSVNEAEKGEPAIRIDSRVQNKPEPAVRTLVRTLSQFKPEPAVLTLSPLERQQYNDEKLNSSPANKLYEHMSGKRQKGGMPKNFWHHANAAATSKDLALTQEMWNGCFNNCRKWIKECKKCEIEHDTTCPSCYGEGRDKHGFKCRWCRGYGRCRKCLGRGKVSTWYGISKACPARCWNSWHMYKNERCRQCRGKLQKKEVEAGFKLVNGDRCCEVCRGSYVKLQGIDIDELCENTKGKLTVSEDGSVSEDVFVPPPPTKTQLASKSAQRVATEKRQRRPTGPSGDIGNRLRRLMSC